jgi:hypothetical protein
MTEAGTGIGGQRIYSKDLPDVDQASLNHWQIRNGVQIGSSRSAEMIANEIETQAL